MPNNFYFEERPFFVKCIENHRVLIKYLLGRSVQKHCLFQHCSQNGGVRLNFRNHKNLKKNKRIRKDNNICFNIVLKMAAFILWQSQKSKKTKGFEKTTTNKQVIVCFNIVLKMAAFILWQSQKSKKTKGFEKTTTNKQSFVKALSPLVFIMNTLIKLRQNSGFSLIINL